MTVEVKEPVVLTSADIEDAMNWCRLRLRTPRDHDFFALRLSYIKADKIAYTEEEFRLRGDCVLAVTVQSWAKAYRNRRS